MRGKCTTCNELKKISKLGLCDLCLLKMELLKINPEEYSKSHKATQILKEQLQAEEYNLLKKLNERREICGLPLMEEIDMIHLAKNK